MKLILLSFKNLYYLTYLFFAFSKKNIIKVLEVNSLIVLLLKYFFFKATNTRTINICYSLY